MLVPTSCNSLQGTEPSPPYQHMFDQVSGIIMTENFLCLFTTVLEYTITIIEN